MAKEPVTPERALQLVAMSLATDELKNGLNLLLYLAHQFASDNEDWDLIIGELGQTQYDLECLRATEAWIKRVTGLGVFDRPTRKMDERRKSD